MANSRAEAFAPATIANLGVGFDILGLAVAGAGDTVVAERAEGRGAHILTIEGDGGALPREADKNVATIAANALLQLLDAEDVGVHLTLHKGIPTSSGLGGSAASSVGAVVAVNALLGAPLAQEALLPAALEGEATISGYHADNVAPCLLGGITLTTGTDMNMIQRLPVPEDLYLALVTPDVSVPTVEARAVLPEVVSLKKMVHQTGAVARLVDALYRGDVVAMGRAMASDEVIEPARRHLMPYMDEVRQVVRDTGAHALVISGAGPTLCAVCDDEKSAEAVAKVMEEVYTHHGMACRRQHTSVLKDGASVRLLE